MKAVHVTYNTDHDETTVRLDGDFEALPLIAQLDCLRDALFDLENIYDAKLAAMGKGQATKAPGENNNG